MCMELLSDLPVPLLVAQVYSLIDPYLTTFSLGVRLQLFRFLSGFCQGVTREQIEERFWMVLLDKRMTEMKNTHWE